jgi:hypothetical protein
MEKGKIKQNIGLSTTVVMSGEPCSFTMLMRKNPSPA